MTGFLSWCWSMASAGVRALYDWKLLRRARLPARVISVGNLQAGGTGKTPLVGLVAREAQARGLSVCILSRGYRRQNRRIQVVSPHQKQVAASQVGDEPSLLAQLAPDAWIGVGSNRVEAFYAATAQSGKPFDLVVLDDGFQHHRLHRDVDLLALSSARPRERLFRDFFSAAKRAQLRVWTKGEVPPPVGDIDVQIDFRIPAPSRPGQKFCLVSGVGDPESLERGLKAVGYEILSHRRLRDHAALRLENCLKWKQEAEAQGARILVTGKDFVKWAEQGVSDVERVEPEIVWRKGEQKWQTVLWAR